MSIESAYEALQQQLDSEVHVSDWLQIDQERISAFAAATNDFQWIHLDSERAATESPWGCTIAHGYLIMSLYPYLRGLVAAEAPVFDGVKTVVNYGLNKVRFTNAVKVGAKIRARSVLAAVDKKPGALDITERVTIEIEGEERPGGVADVIMRLVF